ncbi:phosphotyrosine protein phosphatase [Streptococcus pneumoniae]|nr:phosphotyrosine protein phosphatase [Streptococcus pneumoniae]
MKKLVFVCLGNICRSPMAEFVMKSMTDNYEIFAVALWPSLL